MNELKTLDRMAERLVNRIDRYWTKFEETGEQCYAEIASRADRDYRRVRAIRAEVAQ
tara:strand:+ start:6162 stop:6332 length:171 start_codon:yes stop_codon:yes gene_type:complete